MEPYPPAKASSLRQRLVGASRDVRPRTGPGVEPVPVIVSAARLVRIDPSTGESELVWRGPRLGLFDRYWLAADRDGQVLLFSSSGILRKHVTVRFEADPYVLGTAHAVLARFEQGALLGAPLVDHFGYQFVTAKGREGLRSERITSLGQRPGLVVDLSRCL